MFRKTSAMKSQHNFLTHIFSMIHSVEIAFLSIRGTQREYSSKPLKHSIVERILVFKR